MGNTNMYEGGIGFAGDTGETQAPEYRTVRKSSLSPEQQATYVSAIQKLGGFNGTKWEAKITKYFDKNDYVIDLQQEGLNQFYLREIFNQYSDDQEDTIPEVEDESYEEYLNNRLVETSKRYDSGLEGDRFNVSNDEQLEVESNYSYPTRFASESDYGDKSVLSDWLLIEKNSQEHELLIREIKDKGLIPSLKLLNKIHPEIRRLKQNKEVSGEYLKFINATREFYGLAPYVSEPEELVEVDQVGMNLEDQEPIPTVKVVTADLAAESQSDGGEVKGSSGIDQEAQPDVGKDDAIEQGSVTTNSVESSLDDGGVDDLFESLPEVDALQQELDRLIVETNQRLSKESEPNKEKLERFKDNARQAISNFQQFVRDHSSPADKANSNVQEQYRQYENTAWDELYKLANLLDGEIVTLPQDRDIQVSHPAGVDTKEYLEQIGYKFDEKGDIVEIMDKGVNIRLNRARTIQNLINSKRPSHILYNKSFTLDDNDIYQGYIIEGLNLNTPDWFELVLSDKQFLEPVIVDETTQSNPELDGNQEELAIVGNSGNVLNAEIVTQSTEQAEGGQITLSNKENTVDFEVVDDPEFAKLLEEMEPIDLVDRLAELREQYARAEEAWNRKPGDEKLEDAFIVARGAYNTELERVLKSKVAEGQESSIHDLFKKEVIDLREKRITQSKELQSDWEKKLNPLKEKFVNFVMKHKKFISRLNLAAGVAGGALALTGVGIPLAGGLAVARRMVSATLLGVSTGEGIRSLGEDADINSFWGKIKFQAVIPKLVQESLASSEDEFKQVSEDVLKERLGTLEAYYRLNGGKFTNDNQQQAYEKVLTELARRVQENVIYAENNKDDIQSDWQEQKPEKLTEGEMLEKAHQRWDERNPLSRNMRYFLDKDIQTERDLQNQAKEDWKKSNPERYTSELLNTISDKRIAELDKFRKNRKTATIAGLGLGLLAGGAVHLFDEVNKPDSVELTDSSGSPTGDPIPEVKAPGTGLGGASAPEAGAVAPKPNLETTPPTGTGAATEEAVRQARAAAAVAAAAEQAQELAQDVSSLDSGETISNQIARWLGAGASEAQIQQAVENYLQSELGQESVYKLAQGTEDGRELLAQWGIDNADAMASLSKEQLFEISRYLAPGELEGLTELSLDNLNALEQAEYLESSPVVEPTVESADTQPPASPSGTEAPASPPAPEEPPTSESAVVPPTSEATPVATSEFTSDLSEILGKQNLTDSQIGSILEAYADTDQGRKSLYNLIITSEVNNPTISEILDKYNITYEAKLSDLPADQLNILAQEVGVDNLDKLPGFELNDIILSKFEDAPDTVELVMGLSPLDVVQRYVANELGDLPYDSSLPKNIVDNILDTDEGKEWFLKSITENPDGAPAKGDIRFMHARLFFNRNGITQGSDIDWNKLDQLRNGFVRHKIFWQDFPFKVDDKTVNLSLSRLLKPGPIPGIKDAVRQVLTRQ